MASSTASRILVIGGTGHLGKHIVRASARSGHPTFVLVRSTVSTDPAKAALIKEFTDSGVTLVEVPLTRKICCLERSMRRSLRARGDLYDHGSLVAAIKTVDVVISVVGFLQLADQGKIVAAIKEAGGVKRFLPSEFGNDADRHHAVEPAKTTFAGKAQLRRTIEAEGIPYTYVVSNSFAGYFLPSIGQTLASGLPADKVTILGDGNAKVIYVAEEDIGVYTLKAADDPRTLNKILYIKPPANTLSHNELVELWEKKVGKKFERVYVPEQEVLKQISESPLPLNALLLSVAHSIYVNGDQTNFEIDPAVGAEATELYPEVKYTTVEEYLNRFL